MAAALAGHALAEQGCDTTVRSAGFVGSGVPPSEATVEILAERGLDAAGHLSSRVSADVVSTADLVLTTTRQHLIDVVVLSPDTWSHCFTLADAVRRARAVGPRSSDVSVEAWVARLHGGRQRSSLLSLPLEDDIADPMGQRRSAYLEVLDHLDALVSELTSLLCPA